MELLRRLACRVRVEERFVFLPPELFPQLIQRHSGRRAIEPAGTVRALSVRGSRELPEDFRRELFGASGVSHDARDDSGDTGILGAKDSVQVEVRRFGPDVG